MFSGREPRLLLTVRNGKRSIATRTRCPPPSRSMSGSAKRSPNHRPEDFLFLPDYPNRATASRIVQRQFNAVLDRAGLKTYPFTGMRHSIYSLRHTVICMRIILSEGTSTSSTSPRTPGPRWSRSSGSTPATCR